MTQQGEKVPPIDLRAGERAIVERHTAFPSRLGGISR
jgi:hypothetical protein